MKVPAVKLSGKNQAALILAAGALLGAVWIYRRKNRTNLRPSFDDGAGLTLAEGTDIEATKRAVRNVGVATWM